MLYAANVECGRGGWQVIFMKNPGFNRGYDGGGSAEVHERYLSAKEPDAFIMRIAVKPSIYFLNPDVWAFKSLKRFLGDISGFDCRFSGVGGCFSGPSSEIKSIENSDRAHDSKNYLAFVQKNGFVGSFRHLPLFAQIGLIVICGIGTIWATPVGLALLDVWQTKRKNRRKLQIGIGLLIVSMLSWLALILILFFGI
jgi:hypothetical protein